MTVQALGHCVQALGHCVQALGHCSKNHFPLHYLVTETCSVWHHDAED